MSNRDVLESPPNIFTPIILLCGYQHYQRQSILANLISDKRFAVSPVVLEEDFCLKEDVYLTFPPKVNDFKTREAIRHFQLNVENAIKHINYVCCCSSRFVDLLKLKSIFDNNAVLTAVFETYIFHYYNFNVYGCYSESFNFYHDC